ncbi:uncharacterized protein LOC143055916 [Mytilus galloprovincialis]|uniref:uncharacterized protein LOC143055916 n=1 Tax=Mytilus galloprovincialis TaxID=29158 RepID=UPI003F7C024F
MKHMKMCKLQLYLYVIGLSTVLADVRENSDVQYISRLFGNKRRLCIPIVNCPPGNEILPCSDDHTKDICHPCPLDLVQPNYIQSTQDTKQTECFKNKNKDKCHASDIEPSRTSNAKMCSYAKFCQCNTDECYYGDPCACMKKMETCGVGETLNENGTCVHCPYGTWKNETGCGPCISTGDSVVVKSSTVQTTNKPVKREDTIKVATTESHILSTEKTESTTIQRKESFSIPSVARVTMEPSSSWLVAIVIVLVLMVVVGIILIAGILLKYTRQKNDGADKAEEGRLLDHQQNNGTNGHYAEAKGNLQNNLRNANLAKDLIHSVPKVESIIKKEHDAPVKNSNEMEKSSIPEDRCANKLKSIEIKNADALPKIITKIINNEKVNQTSDDESCVNTSTSKTNFVLESRNNNNISSLELSQEEYPEDHQRNHSTDFSLGHNVSSDLAHICDKNEDRLLECQNPRPTQLSEQKSTPITQVSEDGIGNYIVSDEQSSGYESAGRNSESTESLRSNLENHEFGLVGDTMKSIPNGSLIPEKNISDKISVNRTDCKQTI